VLINPLLAFVSRIIFPASTLLGFFFCRYSHVSYNYPRAKGKFVSFLHINFYQTTLEIVSDEYKGRPCLDVHVAGDRSRNFNPQPLRIVPEIHCPIFMGKQLYAYRNSIMN